jgi:hypothetical protein
MLIEGRDYGCTDEGGIYFCWGRSGEVEQIYQQLQRQLRALGADVPDDAKMAPITVLALQQVLTTLHRSVPLPPALAQIVAAPDPVLAIKLAAAHAKDAFLYVGYVLSKHPHALVSPPIATFAAPPPSKFPVRPVLYAVGGAAFLAGVGAITHKMSRRAAGVDDARHFLPADQDDDDDEDGDEE